VIGAVGVAVGAAGLAERHMRLSPYLVVTIVLGLIVAPLPTCALAFMLWSVARFRRASAARRADRAAEDAALEAGELIVLALAGGSSVAAAVRLADRHCAVEIAPALRSLGESMSRRGVVPALAADSGPMHAVSSVLVTATASGAPVVPALEAHLAQERHRRHTRSVEAARRLPIRLLLPLTLLVLPGFVLITVGPAVIESLARLSP
jgi:hypothetical protein